MGFLARALKPVANIFRPTPGQLQVAASMVRPLEANAHYGRQGQYQALELVGMFAGVVKCAASRNGAGIASNPIRVYRKAAGPMKSAYFAGRAVSPKRVKSLARSAGLHARKALASMGDEVEEVTDPLHPLCALLASVNAINNPFEVMEGTEIGLGLTGTHYWKLAFDGSTGLPVEFWPMHAQHVHPVPDRERIISGYVFGRGTETEALYDADEVIQFKRVNPRGDPYFGMGDLAACVSEARLGFQFVAIAQAMIDNGMQSGGVLQGPFTPEQRQQLEVSMQARNAGPQNAGRYMILSVPDTTKFTPTPMGEKEVAFLSSSERVDSVVSYCFDIPVEFLRMRPGGLGSDGNPGIEQWQKYGLQPRGQKIEDTLNARLVPYFNDDGLFVAFDPWVDEDDSAKVEQVVNMWSAGLLKKNEARVECGYDADLDAEDGDEYKTPDPVATQLAKPIPDAKPPPAKSMYESGFPTGARVRVRPGMAHDDMTAKATGTVVEVSSAALGVKFDGMDEVHHWYVASELMPSDDATKNGQRLRLTGAVGICLATMILSPTAKASHCCTSHGKELSYNQHADENERRMERALAIWMLSLENDVALRITAEGVVPEIASSLAIRAGFDAATGPALESAIRAGIEKGVAETGVAAAEEAIRAAVKAQQDRAWESVSKTLQARIETAVAEAKSAGGTLFELQAAAREAVQRAAAVTPENVSTFEVGNAYMVARERIWAESGLDLVKRWKTARNPCQVCDAMAAIYNGLNLKAGDQMLVKGESVMLGGGLGLLTASYADLYGPPLHGRCRCWLTTEKA